MRLCDHFKAAFSLFPTLTPTPLSLSLSVTERTGMAMILDSILGLALLMLLVLAIILLFICKPWRFFLSSYRNRSITIKVDDLERPLVSEDLSLVPNQSNEFERSYDLEGSCVQSEVYLSSPRARGLVHKQRIPPAPPHLVEGGSLVLDVITDASEDVFVGQTLKRPFMSHHSIEEQHIGKEVLSYELKLPSDNDGFQEFVRQDIVDQCAYQKKKDIVDQRSNLTLEVISGPSRGDRCSISSTNASRLPLTLGRVSPSDLLVKDSEVSGKHAMINWNSNKLKWELVDMGSLNGTLLNSQSINHPNSGRRHWGDPIELASGDIITLGTTSKIYVQIASETKCQLPFGLGIASDPMALRRGGKKLPMEDVCYHHWPLSGTDKFGLFGICDGHGGAAAAKSASKILPDMVASILSDPLKRENVLLRQDASEVLRDALSQTEAFLNHHYEGCTATVLLVWTDGLENFYAQCANVGDSACVMNVDGKLIKMTEDHRVTSLSERQRIKEVGEPLKEGETRLCGLNLARMLGDKYMKEQDSRFSSEPYISPVVHINQASSRGFALLASDGFWDVISPKKAIQLVIQMKDRCSPGREKSAEKIANFLLGEARTLRTKDNTTILFLDFDSSSRKTFL